MTRLKMAPPAAEPEPLEPQKIREQARQARCELLEQCQLYRRDLETARRTLLEAQELRWWARYGPRNRSPLLTD